jgi:hypothetical protein
MQSTHIQFWLARGLPPMQHALLRRIVTREASTARRVKDGVVCPPIQIQWMDPIEFPTEPESVSREQPDVAVIHRDLLAVSAEHASLTPSPVYDPLIRPGADVPPLRLAWNWTTGNAGDVAWCVPWLADGVIFNTKTLESWVRSALCHGAKHPKPLHPLLRDLIIPGF